MTPSAGIDEGNCDYSCLGCTNTCSGNFDPNATLDDGSCTPVLGCTDAIACNYDPCADLNFGCVYFDACGVCDGPGAIYQCGCADVPCWSLPIVMEMYLTNAECAGELVFRSATATVTGMCWTTVGFAQVMAQILMTTERVTT